MIDKVVPTSFPVVRPERALSKTCLVFDASSVYSARTYTFKNKVVYLAPKSHKYVNAVLLVSLRCI